MNAAFDFSLETFVYFGGYPGCAPFIQDEPRWRAYVRRALIDPNIERDILQMTRVDKRADIRISVDNRIELPIEIKLDSNPKLVRDLREQLIARYTHAPKTDDHGIYLVFWFGARPGDRKRRPPLDCPKALQAHLESRLQPAERGRIHVRVMDISLPR